MTEPKIVQKLNARQRKFVTEYLKDYNATAAYVRAGYSEKTANASAHKLLVHAGIQAALANKTSKAEKKAEVTRAEVLATYTQIARANVTDVLTFGVRDNAELAELHRVLKGMSATPDGVLDALQKAIRSQSFVTLKNSDDLPPEIKAAIAEVSQGKDGTVRVKFHSKTDALAKIGQHFGMFKEIVKHEGEVAVTSAFDTVHEAFQKKQARDKAPAKDVN